jgi:hypothetical protein
MHVMEANCRSGIKEWENAMMLVVVQLTFPPTVPENVPVDFGIVDSDDG